jgi:hypothetical protein
MASLLFFYRVYHDGVGLQEAPSPDSGEFRSAAAAASGTFRDGTYPVELVGLIPLQTGAAAANGIAVGELRPSDHFVRGLVFYHEPPAADAAGAAGVASSGSDGSGGSSSGEKKLHVATPRGAASTAAFVGADSRGLGPSELLASEAFECIEKLHARNTPYNILIADRGRRLYLLPRQPQSRAQKGSLELGIRIVAGFPEMSGLVTMLAAEDYAKATGPLVRRFFENYVSLGFDDFEKLKKECFPFGN